jgi:hypothetical protein
MGVSKLVLALVVAAGVAVAAISMSRHSPPTPLGLVPAGARAPESAPRHAEPAPKRDLNNASDVSAGAEFHGYACTVDCSGHEKGYEWAQEHGVTDPDECPIDPNNSHSCTEGCWAFAGREGP